MEVTDLLVDTNDPDGLDRILNKFGAAICGGGMPGGYSRHEGHYIARCFGDPGFIRHIITQQGYGTVIGELIKGEALED